MTAIRTSLEVPTVIAVFKNHHLTLRHWQAEAFFGFVLGSEHQRHRLAVFAMIIDVGRIIMFELRVRLDQHRDLLLALGVDGDGFGDAVKFKVTQIFLFGNNDCNGRHQFVGTRSA